jgi:hypothetical protein
VTDPSPTSNTANDPHAARLDELLDRLASAPEAERPAVQNELFETAGHLLASAEGLSALWRRADRFDAAGVFFGGPWADASKLQVPLVAGTLRGPGITPIVETLSELRLLAIATGRATSDVMPKDEAVQVLDEVLARNLGYLFPSDDLTEQEREGGDQHRESHQRLFSLIVDEIGVERVLGEVVAEVEQVLAQRPISTWATRRMIKRAWRLATASELEGAAVDTLRQYVEAFEMPSDLARRHPRLADYRSALDGAEREVLDSEARTLASSMLRTGLVASQHAVLIRHLLHAHTDLLTVALGTDEAGSIEVESNAELVHRLIEGGVFATTAQCLYGLTRALNRTLFSRREVAAGLERLLELEIRQDVQDLLLAHRSDDDPVTPNAVLMAGTMAVLGQPLGVGQGRNPTCQAARGISLWAQSDPAHLLELIVAGARDGRIELRFNGQMLQSDQILAGVATKLDLDLDPVSIVLVPHLDRLYAELMRRSMLRFEDAHKWVNPALYGQWVANELASAFVDLAQTTVSSFETFVNRFFATHHPDYNGGHRLMWPNPVGLVITNHRGKYLGPHAVSIQRVDEDPDGVMRVYFFNPNNEGRQDWGAGVVVSVCGHGEKPGESSLPFDDFAARVYAFHFNPSEEGQHTAVDDDRVHAIMQAARSTWGERFIWLEQSVA